MRPQSGNKIEASTLSKSSMSQAVDANQRNAIATGTSSIFDVIFPLVDELLKSVQISKALYGILIFYNTIQLLSISFWPGFLALNEYEGTFGKIAKILCIISFYTDLSASQTTMIIRFCILTVLFFLLIFVLIAQAVIYSNNRRFIKWTLYPTRFIVEFLPLIMLAPMGLNFSTLFNAVIHSPTTIEIVFFVLTVIYMAFIVIVHYVCSMFFAASAYISTAPTASWDGPFYFWYTAGAPMFVLLSEFLTIFNKWFVVVYLVLKIVFNLGMMYWSWWMPLVHETVNAFVFVMFPAVTSMDIVTLVRLVGVSIPYYVYFICALGFLVILTPIMFFVTKKRISKIKKQLQTDALEAAEGYDEETCPIKAPAPTSMCQEEQKRVLYWLYKLDRSQSRCQLYMRVGLAEHCPLFTDWSLIKFVAEFHPTKTMLANITQFLTFFPAESRLLNVFFLQTISQPNLSWPQRFMLYEVHRVKGLRLSSASSEITEKVMDLKRMSQAGLTTVREFWRHVPNSVGVFYDIRSSTTRTGALFAEAMDKWPNNVRLCEDYANFLVECATDYVNGVKIQHRADLIEQGKNFVVDISFRSLVRAYPLYLKRNIMDVKGNFIAQKQQNGRQGSTSSSNNSQMSTGTIDGELDVEIEEQLAKQSFSNHRVRLAYQRALIGKRSRNSRNLKLSGIWTLLLSMAISLFCFAYYYNHYADRANNMNRQFTMNKYRYGYDASCASIIISWLRKLDIIGEDLYEEMAKQEGVGSYSLDLLIDPIDEAARWSIFAESALGEFMTQVSEVAAMGDDVFTIVHDQIEDVIAFQYCLDGVKMPNYKLVSLHEAVSYNFVIMRSLFYNTDEHTWRSSNEICEVFANIPNMATSFDNMQLTMGYDQNTKEETTETLNNIIMIPVAIGFFFVTEPLLLVFVLRMFNELEHMLDLMAKLDDQTKQEASKLLKRDSGEEEQNEKLSDTTKSNGLSKWFFIVLVFFPIFLFVALFIGVIQLAQMQNRSFLQLNDWMTLGVSRANLMLEVVWFMSLAMAITPGPLDTKMMTRELCVTVTKVLSSNLLSWNNELLRGAPGVEPCIGVNEEFDKLNLDPTCILQNVTETRHDIYNCLSLDRSITYFTELVDQMIENIATEAFTIDSDFYHMFHIVNNHMVEKSYKGAAILSQLAADSNLIFQQQLAGICFGGMLFMILGFILFWKNLLKLDVAYDGALQLMRRIPPSSVVSNTQLLNFLLNRSSDKNTDKMTASKLVVHVSKDAVVCLNRHESIEVVNQAVSGLFGYTPEQLLGQPVATLLPQDKAEKVFSHINLMRLGQCAMTYETTSEGLTDDEQVVPVHVTLIGICEPNQSQAKSFVVILRDETQLQKQRKEAEEAKAQSENLLYQILPRDIVVRLNQGESDISFSVPSATIIFVDIVKFSDYAATLSPSQIMENLSAIFARFDILCAKYNLITKIKLIGDVYMAAAGLFTPEEPIANHASQVVQFGLDVLVALDELNSQLDSSLQVRIGVNTDGPLIAGVLGTDKPVFDIIGDPINVASRLQSTCIPMTVQISQMTYDAISGMSFNIEQRGEVELKGKGKKMAYIVRPITNGSFFFKSDKFGESEGFMDG